MSDWFHVNQDCLNFVHDWMLMCSVEALSSVLYTTLSEFSLEIGLMPEGRFSQMEL